MNLKVSNRFLQPKTPEELNEILDNQFNSVTLERASAEQVKGLTVNLIAYMLNTGYIAIGCSECENVCDLYIEKHEGDLLCYSCVRPTHGSGANTVTKKEHEKTLEELHKLLECAKQSRDQAAVGLNIDINLPTSWKPKLGLSLEETQKELQYSLQSAANAYHQIEAHIKELVKLKETL